MSETAQIPAPAVTARSRVRTNVLKNTFKVPTRPPTGGRAVAENFTTPARKATLLYYLEQYLGVVHFACKAAQVPRQTFYNWRDNDEDFRAKVEDIQEIAVDYAESQLLANIKAGKEPSLIFFLKTRGRGRGYVERTEVTGADGGPVEVRI